MQNFSKKAIDPGRQIKASLILAGDPAERHTLLRNLNEKKNVPPVHIKRLNSDISIPRYETEGSVGFDLAAAADITIQPKQIALVPTGLIIEVPKGYALILASRSSTPRKFGLLKPHGIGVIDLDYCGPSDEIKIQVYNFTSEPTQLTKGDRVAYGLFVRVDKLTFHEVDEMQTISRGGFGSTDEDVLPELTSRKEDTGGYNQGA